MRAVGLLENTSRTSVIDVSCDDNGLVGRWSCLPEDRPKLYHVLAAGDWRTDDYKVRSLNLQDA